MAKVVLIVDDCEDLSDLCAFLLRHEGFDVDTACDGDQGLKAVAARRPDLIVLDMMMPGLDGLAFLERLPTVTSVPPPVIACSGFDKFEELALLRGASAFLRKPFDTEELSELATALLERRHGAVPNRAGSDAQRAIAAQRREVFWRDAPTLSIDLLVDLQRLVDSAARYFGAASSFVTALRDGALHVLAEHGASERFPAGSAMDPRVNFCPDVIAATAPLLIEDGPRSLAFADHPAAAGDVRFYAGAPLLTRDGLALGTLCLEDPRPRSFAAEDLALVRHLAHAAGEAIDAEHRREPWTALHVDDGVVHPRILEVLLDAELRRAERDGGTVELAIAARSADAALAADFRAAVPSERLAIAQHPDGAALLVGVHDGVDARWRMDALVRSLGARVIARVSYDPRRHALAASALMLLVQAWRALPSL
jgi:CheY-like chemotaxis protein